MSGEESPVGGDQGGLTGLFAAARARADASDAGSTPAWGRICAEVRRRRRRRTAGIVALWVLTVTAGVAGAVMASGGAGGPHDTVLPGSMGSPMTASEYRLFLPSERVRVVLDRSAATAFRSPAELSLFAGTAWVELDSRRGPVRFDVVTPEVRVTAKGTRFGVSFLAGRGTRVGVAEGVVTVSVAGREMPVPAGTEWASGAGRVLPIGQEWQASLASLLPAGSDERPAGAGAQPMADESRPTGGETACSGFDLHSAADGGTSADASAGPSAAEVDARLTSPAPVPVAAGAEDVPRSERSSTDAATEATGAEALYDQAEQALAAGRIEEALGLLARVAEQAARTPLGGTALVDLGARLMHLGRFQQAGEIYRRYLSEQSNGAWRDEARVALCRIDRSEGLRDDARACYRVYLAETPTGRYADEARRALQEGSP